MVKKNGIHYLHVKNKLGDVKTNKFITNAVGENAVDKIVGLAATNTNELRIDEHAATGQQTFPTKEYRYWGKDPNNYVWFNNELWRIIGAMDVDDGSSGIGNVGIVEKRLKIIRDKSIGNYSWDSSLVNGGAGINEWSQADIMYLFNSGAYYNRTTGTCYNGLSNVSTPCDFSENSSTPGLTSEAKEMIGNAKWYLGSYSSYAVKSSDIYIHERGTLSSKQCSSADPLLVTYCNDNVARTTAWVGKIGLMYPSDYGYSANMENCQNIDLSSYNSSCYGTAWLYKSNINQWVLTPFAAPNVYADGMYQIAQNGALYVNGVSGTFSSRPATYLLPSIQILDGEGTTKRPFVLSK